MIDVREAIASVIDRRSIAEVIAAADELEAARCRADAV